MEVSVVGDEKVEAWINKAPPDMREIIQSCRAVVLGIDLRINEEIKWRNPFFQREGQNLGAVVPYKNYVNLLFWKAVFLDDTKDCLEGTGREARYLKISSPDEIDETYIIRLMRETLDLYARQSD